MLALAALALPGAGCGALVRRTPAEVPPRPARPLPDEVRARFAFEVVTPVRLERLPDEGEGVAEVWSGGLALRLAGDDLDTPVQFEWWRSLRAPPVAPAVVVTPILGGGRSLAVGHCEDLTAAGLHAVLVERGTRVLARHWEVEEVEAFLRRGVAARLAVVDWLAARPDVDPDGLGAFGISMGGLLTTVLLAIEPRLRAGVIALAGGDVASIIRESTEGRLVTWREERAAALGLSQAALEQRLRAALPSDPGQLAPYVGAERVLCVTTRWDQVVRPRNQQLLWARLGRPERLDLPAGHYGAIVFLPHVMAQAVEFLAARLAPGARPAAGATTAPP